MAKRSSEYPFEFIMRRKVMAAEGALPEGGEAEAGMNNGRRKDGATTTDAKPDKRFGCNPDALTTAELNKSWHTD